MLKLRAWNSVTKRWKWINASSEDSLQPITLTADLSTGGSFEDGAAGNIVGLSDGDEQGGSLQAKPASGDGHGGNAIAKGGDSGEGGYGGKAALQGGSGDGGSQAGASIGAYGGQDNAPGYAEIVSPGPLLLTSNNLSGEAGQVLVANGDGTCGWATP